MSKITVIHHSADYDGLFCREIARKFLPDAELIGWDYGDPLIPMPAEGTVYILDLSPDCLTDVNSNDFNRVVWIDHHKSAIDKYGATGLHDKIPGYRIDGVAACRLAWQWFTMVDGNTPRVGAEIGIPIRPAGVLPMIQDYKNREVNEPLAVRLAGEYDIWDKRDPRAELFQHGLKSQPLGQNLWRWMLGTDCDPSMMTSSVEALLKQGEVLQFARANEYRDVITQQGFDIDFNGLKFLACCSHELDIRSHLFEAGIKPEHDALLGFTFTGKDWRVSMYHAPGNEHHDLSKIAVEFGGGGHRGACGFRAKDLDFSEGRLIATI